MAVFLIDTLWNKPYILTRLSVWAQKMCAGFMQACMAPCAQAWFGFSFWQFFTKIPDLAA
jgi:hypothetical protein